LQTLIGLRPAKAELLQAASALFESKRWKWLTTGKEGYLFFGVVLPSVLTLFRKFSSGESQS